jgi:hypothetical protein
MPSKKDKHKDHPENPSLFSKFKLTDMYGSKIGLTFNGSNVFRTYLGAFASIIVLLCVLAFLVYRCYIMVYKLGTVINKNSFISELNTAGSF